MRRKQDIFVPEYKISFDRQTGVRLIMVQHEKTGEWRVFARIVKGHPTGTKKFFYRHVGEFNEAPSRWFPTMRDCIFEAVYGLQD